MFLSAPSSAKEADTSLIVQASWLGDPLEPQSALAEQGSSGSMSYSQGNQPEMRLSGRQSSQHLEIPTKERLSQKTVAKSSKASASSSEPKRSLTRSTGKAAYCIDQDAAQEFKHSIGRKTKPIPSRSEPRQHQAPLSRLSVPEDSLQSRCNSSIPSETLADHNEPQSTQSRYMVSIPSESLADDNAPRSPRSLLSDRSFITTPSVQVEALNEKIEPLSGWLSRASGPGNKPRQYLAPSLRLSIPEESAQSRCNLSVPSENLADYNAPRPPSSLLSKPPELSPLSPSEPSMQSSAGLRVGRESYRGSMMSEYWDGGHSDKEEDPLDEELLDRRSNFDTHPTGQKALIQIPEFDDP